MSWRVVLNIESHGEQTYKVVGIGGESGRDTTSSTTTSMIDSA